jgi:hypothetical protein
LLFEVTAWYRAARTRLRYGILKPAASVYVTSFGEWLEITPEGFFDASPNGATLLSIVRGLDVYSIDRFYDTLHRPDLVREKLAGDPQGKVREAAAKVDLTKAGERQCAEGDDSASCFDHSHHRGRRQWRPVLRIKVAELARSSGALTAPRWVLM